MRLALRPEVVAAGTDVSRSVELFHRVNQQDLYASGGVLVPSEHHIGAFHDWVTAALA